MRDICNYIEREALVAHLNSLRKDLAARFVDPILLSSAVVRVEAGILALHAAGDPANRLTSLSALPRFIHDNLLPHLPPDLYADFAASLYSPVVTAVLRHLLEPSLPSTLDKLPGFLALVRDAVAFESSIAADCDIHGGRERILHDWADNLPTYYEKQRRQQLLEEARAVLLDGSADSVRVDAPPSADAEHLDAPTHSDPPAPEPPKEDDFENSWDFEDAAANGRTSTDSWGFDDDAEDEAKKVQEPPAHIKPPDIAILPSDEDSSNGWGWDDDGEDAPPAATTVQEDEDDPWETAWADPAPSKPPASAPAQVETFDAPSSPMKPKSASRLEKKLAKSRGLNVPTTPMSANPVGAKSFSSSQHQGFQSEPVSAHAQSPQPGAS